MKNIISYSLWGTNDYYLNGAVENAKQRLAFYPDWTCRFYIDDTVTQKYIDELKNYGAEIYMMGKTTDALGMYWRFHPMYDDPEIDRFIVRDTDCRFSQREVNAVNAWIMSGKDFHFMRDNAAHNVPICGGMWGARAGAIKSFEMLLSLWFSQLQPDFRNTRGMFFGSDQAFLAQVVWPHAINSHLAHVRAGEVGIKYTGNEIDFPPLIDGHFVGCPL